MDSSSSSSSSASSSTSSFHSSSSSSQCRAVVVDSLLCFLHNFRHLPQLSSLILRHFPAQSMVRSLQLLVQLSPDPDELVFSSSSSVDCHFLQNDPSALLRSIIRRFDRIANSGQMPIFAASDLLSLPFCPLSSSADALEDQSQSQLATSDELRHIRFLLQQLFWLHQHTLLERNSSNSSTISSLPQHPPPPMMMTFPPSSSPSSSSIFPPAPTSHQQFVPHITSSPEYPPSRPLPSVTPKNVQTASTDDSQSQQSKGRGSRRLDHVVAKLTRGKGMDEEGRKSGGGSRAVHQQPKLHRHKEEETEATAKVGEEDDEARSGRDGNNGKAAADGNNLTQPKNLFFNSFVQPQPQQNNKLVGPNAAVALVASSYAMQMLRHLSMESMDGEEGKMETEEQPSEMEKRKRKKQELEEEEDDDNAEEEEMQGEEEEMEGRQCTEMNADDSKVGIGEGNEYRQWLSKEMMGQQQQRTDEGVSSPMSEDGSEWTTTKEEGAAEEKPLCCNWPNCQKRFRNKFLLKKHRFIHSGEKPHKCPFCAKQFNRKDNLLRHKKTHLQNGLAELGGLKRRHNMLYGVSAEEAMLNGMLPLGTATTAGGSKQRRKKQQAKKEAEEEEESK